MEAVTPSLAGPPTATTASAPPPPSTPPRTRRAATKQPPPPPAAPTTTKRPQRRAASGRWSSTKRRALGAPRRRLGARSSDALSFYEIDRCLPRSGEAPRARTWPDGLRTSRRPSTRSSIGSERAGESETSSSRKVGSTGAPPTPPQTLISSLNTVTRLSGRLAPRTQASRTWRQGRLGGG